ncbi:MAG: NADH-quinone oxidoreductase subunit M, partial [Gammaproteobacteria bacterium]|nr:NADH-quinone oxidoreductase subunit M [Gammaproteobacteria bacterium]
MLEINFQHIILNLMIWLPIVGGLLVLLLHGEQHALRSRIVALSISLATIALCVPLWWMFDTSYSMMQFQDIVPWISSYGIYYNIGV